MIGIPYDLSRKVSKTTEAWQEDNLERAAELVWEKRKRIPIFG